MCDKITPEKIKEEERKRKEFMDEYGLGEEDMKGGNLIDVN